MNLLKKWLQDYLEVGGHKPLQQSAVEMVRARPGQDKEISRYVGSQPDVAGYLRHYALSPWVYTGVARLAEVAAVARLRVVEQSDLSQMNDKHEILRLLGVYGIPNDQQDNLEFWEEHLTFFDLSGNSFWYWVASYGGAPEQVFNLNPSRVRVIPGRSRTVEGYEYRVNGGVFPMSVEEVTHFKRPNPFNTYYGMPAIEAVLLDSEGDRLMAEWNVQLFDDGVSIPAGMFIIDPNVDDKQRDRLERELNARYGEKRRTAVIRAESGKTAWYGDSLAHREMDFRQGRLLARQSIMDALDLPLGYLSDASTEAHARVAERRYYASAQRRLIRTERKLNAMAMQFWAGWDTQAVQFDDLRREHADWEQEERKITSLLKIFTVDEVRSMEFNAGAYPEEKKNEELPLADDQREAALDRRDTDTVSDD
jgi:phage portal protein BeeE